MRSVDKLGLIVRYHKKGNTLIFKFSMGRSSFMSLWRWQEKFEDFFFNPLEQETQCFANRSCFWPSQLICCILHFDCSTGYSTRFCVFVQNINESSHQHCREEKHSSSACWETACLVQDACRSFCSTCMDFRKVLRFIYLVQILVRYYFSFKHLQCDFGVTDSDCFSSEQKSQT